MILLLYLISYAAQRTYIFAADTETDLKEWKAAMDNCMAKFISGGTIRTDSTNRLVRNTIHSMVTMLITLCIFIVSKEKWNYYH